MLYTKLENEIKTKLILFVFPRLLNVFKLLSLTITHDRKRDINPRQHLEEAFTVINPPAPPELSIVMNKVNP